MDLGAPCGLGPRVLGHTLSVPLDGGTEHTLQLGQGVFLLTDVKAEFEKAPQGGFI